MNEWMDEAVLAVLPLKNVLNPAVLAVLSLKNVLNPKWDRRKELKNSFSFYCTSCILRYVHTDILAY